MVVTTGNGGKALGVCLHFRWAVLRWEECEGKSHGIFLEGQLVIARFLHFSMGLEDSYQGCYNRKKKDNKAINGEGVSNVSIDGKPLIKGEGEGRRKHKVFEEKMCALR